MEQGGGIGLRPPRPAGQQRQLRQQAHLARGPRDVPETDGCEVPHQLLEQRHRPLAQIEVRAEQFGEPVHRVQHQLGHGELDRRRVDGGGAGDDVQRTGADGGDRLGPEQVGEHPAEHRPHMRQLDGRAAVEPPLREVRDREAQPGVEHTGGHRGQDRAGHLQRPQRLFQPGSDRSERDGGRVVELQSAQLQAAHAGGRVPRQVRRLITGRAFDQQERVAARPRLLVGPREHHDRLRALDVGDDLLAAVDQPAVGGERRGQLHAGHVVAVGQFVHRDGDPLAVEQPGRGRLGLSGRCRGPQQDAGDQRADAVSQAEHRIAPVDRAHHLDEVLQVVELAAESRRDELGVEAVVVQGGLAGWRASPRVRRRPARRRRRSGSRGRGGRRGAFRAAPAGP